MSLPDVADQTNTEGDLVNLQITATDWASGSAGGCGVASGSGYNPWSASGLPGGLGISSTGLISGVIQPGDAANGPYLVTVSYTDMSGNSASKSFAWNVADPVTVNDPGVQTGAEGSAVSLQMTGSDGIRGAAPLTYSAVDLPAGLTISSGGLITGTPAADDAAVGPYKVRVTATDGVYSESEDFEWDLGVWDSVGLPSAGGAATEAVANVAAPAPTPANPVWVVNPGPQTTTPNVFQAPFIDAVDANHLPLTYSAVGLPPGLTIGKKTGLIDWANGPGSLPLGKYTVTVTASDGTNAASQSFQWTVVANPLQVTNPGPQTGSAAQPASLQVMATDAPAAGAITWSVPMGMPPGLKIDPHTGLISGVITAGTSGNYHVMVLANDGVNVDYTSFNWTVSPALSIASIGPQHVTQGEQTSLTIPATDAAGNVPTFTATGLPPGLKLGPTGVISGIPTAQAEGNYDVTVTATDGPYTASRTFSWYVLGSSTGPITMTNPGDQSNAVGDVVSLHVTATDVNLPPPPLGSLKYSASGLPWDLSIDPKTGVISGTITTATLEKAPGVSKVGGYYTVTVTAQDWAGFTASRTFRWTFPSQAQVYLYWWPVGITKAGPGGGSFGSGGGHVGVVVADPATRRFVKYDGDGPGWPGSTGGWYGSGNGIGSYHPLAPMRYTGQDSMGNWYIGQRWGYYTTLDADGLPVFPDRTRFISLSGVGGQALPSFESVVDTLDAAFYATHQIQEYNAWLGPNSNTWARQFLLNAGIFAVPTNDQIAPNTVPGWYIYQWYDPFTWLEPSYGWGNWSSTGDPTPWRF